MTKEEDNALKISVPLITDEEIRQIDNNFESIVNEFTKQLIHDKELATAQHLIQKQQEELKHIKDLNIPVETLVAEYKRLEDLEDDRDMLKAEIKKKDKIIGLMAEYMASGNKYLYATKEDIIREFEKKVEDEQ